LASDIIDYSSLPESSKAQQNATKKLTDPVQYAKDSAQPLAQGLIYSLLGAESKAGSTPRGDARALTGMYSGKTPEQLREELGTGARASADLQSDLGLFEKAAQARRDNAQTFSTQNPSPSPNAPSPPLDAGARNARSPESSPVPPSVPQGLNPGSRDTGGLATPPTNVAADQDASRRISSELSGPVTGRGIGDLPLPSRGPKPEAVPEKPPYHNVRHDAGVTIDGQKVGGRFKTAEAADDAAVTAGTMSGATRDAHNAMRDEIQAWIDKNPDRGSIPRSIIEGAAKRVGGAHGVADVQGLVDAAMKYLGN
jgi:hypothetical protein